MTSKTPGERLEPCPHCGSEDVSPSYCTNVDNVVSGRFVECEDCAACGPVHPSESRAIAAWNRRPTAPASGLGEEERRAVSKAIRILGDVSLHEATRLLDARDLLVAALSPPPREGGRGASVAESAAGSATRDAAGDAQRKSEGGA